MTYASESTALDREVLALIERWHRGGAPVDEGDFEDLAVRIFAHQLQYNDAYARYAGTFGYSAASLPTSWHDIPAVPAAAYKEATLATFDPSRAALAFETSGTTQGTGGRHYMETRALYDAALLAGFDRFMLPNGARLRYLNLVPNPAVRPQSSLGYMMARVSAERGDGNTGWYLRDEDIFVEAFMADVQAAIADDQPVCIASTAFALVHVLDALEQRSLVLPLPAGSRIMETGGFKGRSRIVERDALYAELCHRFVCPDAAITAEYGMTELTSQYYDAVPTPKRVLRQAQDDKWDGARGIPSVGRSAPSVILSLSKDALGDTLGARYKVSPPWLRVRVVGPDGRSVRNGIVGSLVHVDLANRSSCVAIATEDLGAAFDEGLVLIGRERGAALRGCSLDAEALRRR